MGAPLAQPPESDLAPLHAAIAECARRFADTRNVDDILRDAVSVIREHIGFDRVGIFLYDESQRAWRGEFGTDQAGQLRDERRMDPPLDPRHPLHRAARGEGEEFFTEDFAAAFPDDGFMRGVRHHVLVALRAHGRLLGAISVDNLLTGRAIGETARTHLIRFARYIALALENFYLVQDLEQRNVALAGELAERQRAERSLAGTLDVLRQSNRDLEQFAYAASHDLQAPLRKIVSFGELLGKEVLSERGADLRRRMVVAAARLEDLVADLLALARASQAGSEAERVELGELVRGVVSDLDARVQATGGRVEIGALPAVMARPAAMRQLFQNLIDNALKFHAPERPPVVSVAAAPRGAADSVEALACVVVADNGIGIAGHDLERMFGLFQRLQASATYEGSGIGLSLCRRIVERAGGSITVASTPGVGTQFTIALPAAVSSGGG
jgi:light-regulated signal transduction histidine kinase (bacteriophytochrome)